MDHKLDTKTKIRILIYIIIYGTIAMGLIYCRKLLPNSWSVTETVITVAITMFGMVIMIVSAVWDSLDE